MTDLENQTMKINIGNDRIKKGDVNEIDTKCFRNNNEYRNGFDHKKQICNNIEEDKSNGEFKIPLKEANINKIKKGKEANINEIKKGKVENTNTMESKEINKEGIIRKGRFMENIDNINIEDENIENTIINKTESKEGTVRKGRFVVERANMTSIESSSTVQIRKGRFYITQTIDDDEKTKQKIKQMINIIDLQNKQIDLLFDMVKNFSNEDKLFQKEFSFISNEVYENIEILKKDKGE